MPEASPWMGSNLIKFSLQRRRTFDLSFNKKFYSEWYECHKLFLILKETRAGKRKKFDHLINKSLPAASMSEDNARG